MTEKENARVADLEQAVIDRERRIFSLASLIRGLMRGEDPKQCCIDLKITPEEARALGILNYARAAEIRSVPG